MGAVNLADLIVAYNDTARPYPQDRTVVHLFEDRVALHPDAEAIRHGTSVLTYGALNARANQIASLLEARGVRPRDSVLLLLEHSLECVATILAVLKLGAADVPLDAAIPPERLAMIARDVAAASSAGAAPILATHTHLLALVPEGAARTVVVDLNDASLAAHAPANRPRVAAPTDVAYVIYTSGSTGTPKGVEIEHRSLVNYVTWASATYVRGDRLAWPLFSSLAFDLTVTSIFTPLISGGRIVVYREEPGMLRMAVFQVVEDNAVDIVKLTPSHLAMIAERLPRSPRLQRFIVGGEDFRTDLARAVADGVGPDAEIYNEYGPTEATVGCMIHRFSPGRDRAPSVPIGVPVANSGVYILDDSFQPTPVGETGEMFIAGDGLARGYLNRPELTAERFLSIPDPRDVVRGGDARSLRVYRTGDLARWSADGAMEFLGRADQQVKIGGARIELGEIEACLEAHPDVRQCAVAVVRDLAPPAPPPVAHCARCGVASALPGTTFDNAGICNLCRAFDTYVDKAEAYFKTREDLVALVAQMRETRRGTYDCIILLSGGKDSTYMLFQMCRLGVTPLVFTLDNGFISEQALANIRRTCDALGVDVVFGTTPHMNEIFADSLRQFSNVCNGCFKTIYTLATNLAREKGIGYIVTGLSRGQFFETRLTEEVFRRDDFDVRQIDSIVLEARKAYHRRTDAVSRYLEVDAFREDSVFDDIQFVDFYRYWSAPLEEMYAFLDEHAAWVRPSDTGRSTNCLINDLGIYLHKKQRGYHNYALPYSWDVRLGQKTRDEAMEELEDEIDEARVREMMAQIGYEEPPPPPDVGVARLVAYYTSAHPVSLASLRAHLARTLPSQMMPAHFVWLEAMPLTANGKVDRAALPAPTTGNIQLAHDFARPQTEIEQALALIWTELLKVERIGLNDDFFDLGGHSLLAIRAVSRIREVFGVELPLDVMFSNPTIAALASALGMGKRDENARSIAPRAGDAPAPLSFPQEQIWFFDRLAPGSPVYNMSDVVRLSGPCDAAAMRRALDELVRRHATLRTAIVERDGRPWQIVADSVSVPMRVLDLRSLDPRERERQWRALVAEQPRMPFDLSHAPLVRATLVHVTDSEHRVLLTFHHIVADEWSMEIVQHELRELYDACARDVAAPLKPLAVQYADFAEWQRDGLTGAELERQRAFWMKQTNGAPMVVELAPDKPRPPVLSFRGASELFEAPLELLDQLREFCRTEQATSFMVLEAAFAALVHRYTGQNDFLVGTPITGRKHRETEGLIGNFLNTVVLRSQFTPTTTFRSLVQQTRERSLGAYAHPDYPFAQLVADLAPERSLSRTPVFQVQFVLHNPEGVSYISDVAGHHELDPGTSKFDLTLYMSESGGKFEGLCEYSTDLYDAESITRFCGHYVTLLAAALRDPGRAVAELPLMSADERRQVVSEWNATERAYDLDHSLADLIEAQAVRTPDLPAILLDGDAHPVSYRELDARANQLAHHLLELGVGPGTLVGVAAERSPELVVALLGVLKAGAAYVPVDPAYPADRVAFLLQDAKAPVLLTQARFVATLPAADVRVIALDAEWETIARRPTSRPERATRGSDPAYVIYTSGSTGQPKGAINSHRGIINRLRWMQDEYRLTPDDVVLQKTPFSFDVSVWEFFWPLLTGARLVLARPGEHGDPSALVRAINDHGVTTLHFVPPMLHAFLDDASAPSCTSLKRIICSGEALAPELRDRCLAALPQAELHNLYGPTEAAVDVSFWACRPDDRRPRVPIGRPVANTHLYVLDARLQPTPIGVPGELHIGGVQVGLGYLGRDALTRERFIPDPFGPAGGRLYKTGDRARWLADGTIEYLGRLDHQVKIRGFRVEVGEIEAALRSHPAVADTVVLAIPAVRGPELRLAACVRPRPGSADGGLTGIALREYLAQRLPAHTIPSVWRVLDVFPLTPNGKTDRNALAALLARGDGVESSAPAASGPTTPTELRVASLWRDVLGSAAADINQNYFDAGGDSLNAVRLVARIRAEFGVDVGLRAIFEQPTIAGLARAVDVALHASAVSNAPRSTGTREEVEL